MKIVIIGGGVAGLSIGWRLAQSGCDTVVLERALPGRGATWASGGMIAAQAEMASAPSAEVELGARSAAMWPQFAAEIEDRSGLPVHFRRSGSMITASSQDELDALSAHVPAGAAMITGADARAREPLLGDDVIGALWAPEDAQVDNRALGLALARAFANAGGTLKVNEAVVRLDIVGDRVVGARTPFALYEADAYILAAGAWSGDLKGVPAEIQPPVVPVKGEMVSLSPPAGVTLPSRLIWGHSIYLIPRGERLFVGATLSREGFDTSTTRAARDWLLSRAARLMPSLSQWTVVEHWAGLRPGSPDDLPIVGPTGLANLHVASGQYRNGILFAPAIADALNSLIVEQRQPPDFQAFHPKRFAAAQLAGEKGVG